MLALVALTSIYHALVVLVLGLSVTASTVKHDLETADPPEVKCIFTDYDSFEKDKLSCAAIVIKDLEVPAGVTLNFTLSRSDVHVDFQGTVTFGYAEWIGPLVLFSGARLSVTSTGGSLNANGSRWWDGLGWNGGKKKPKFFFVGGAQDSIFRNLRFVDSPVHTVGVINSTNVFLDGFDIAITDGEKRGAHNTDGFGVLNSTGVAITDAKVVNQDDCVVVNIADNVLVSGLECTNGHGLSISTGKYDVNTVSNVIFQNSVVSESQNGVRIKTLRGAPKGLVEKVQFKNITLNNITKYGIDIEQNYQNNGSVGAPTNGIRIKSITWENIRGTVSKSAQAVHILCGNSSCSDFVASGISISGGAASTCLNTPLRMC